ncbi:MAG: hypothetical protein ACE5H4_03460 [Candidatus Thorarchaeota archaeon]
MRYDDHFQKNSRRINERRGKSKVYVAVAREIAVACFHMLKKREPYRFMKDELVKTKYKRLEKVANSPLCAG